MEECVVKESSPSLDLLLQFQRLLIARVFPKHNCYLASQADIGEIELENTHTKIACTDIFQKLTLHEKRKNKKGTLLCLDFYLKLLKSLNSVQFWMSMTKTLQTF